MKKIKDRRSLCSTDQEECVVVPEAKLARAGRAAVEMSFIFLLERTGLKMTALWVGAGGDSPAIFYELNRTT